MKTISRSAGFISLAGFMSLAAFFGVISCSDSDSQNAELSPAVQQYLAMRMGSNNAMAESMSGPVNRSFQSLFNQSLQLNGKLASDSSDTPGDTTIITEPWENCAVITITRNEDGSETTVYDYGSGCEQGWEGYTYFMYGKYSSTYRNDLAQEGSRISNTYFYASQYDNYGGNYNGQWSWLMNGGGTYSGKSSYDTVSQEFSGSYSYHDETTYQYDSVTYYYKTEGASSYTNDLYTIQSSDHTYTFGDDFYKSKVLKPLVADYSCYRQVSPAENYCLFWVFVEGRERIQFKNGDAEGSFEIDYGNGACDNIITIYENGRITRVDLGKDLNTDGPVAMSGN